MTTQTAAAEKLIGGGEAVEVAVIDAEDERRDGWRSTLAVAATVRHAPDPHAVGAA
jgi:hypothetical protein